MILAFSSGLYTSNDSFSKSTSGFLRMVIVSFTLAVEWIQGMKNTSPILGLVSKFS
jgi:hypothetical protein